jgi:hypothetical protein
VVEKGGDPLSISLSVQDEHSNTRIPPSSSPGHPHHYHIQWGGGPREPGPLVCPATTAVDWSEGNREGKEVVPVDTEQGQEERQSL